MKPEMSCLKFRHPFYNKDDVANFNSNYITDEFKKSEIQYAENYKRRELYYMKGDIYIQAYAPKSSAETRLYVSKNDIHNIIKYDSYKLYESTMFYYNVKERPLQTHSNPYTFNGFDRCGDCSIEYHIWDFYNKISDNKIDIKNEVKYVSDFLKRPLH